MTDQSLNPQNQRKKPAFSQVLIPVAVILTLVLIGLSLLKRHQDSQSHAHGGAGVLDVSTGAQLPDLELQSLDGKTTKLSEVPGKVILINFWATWCGPCIHEMPSINQLRKTYQSQGFEVIGVNVDENPGEVLEPFRKKLGIEFPSYIDPKGSLAEKFDVHGIPYTVVVDAERKVLHVESGDRDWFANDVQKKLKGWLGI